MTDTRPAKQVFKEDVYASLMKCSGDSCHNTTATSGAIGKFYTASADTTYDATVAATTIVGSTFSALSPVLTHVQAGHKGLSYTPDETTKMTNWLTKEATERAGGGSGSGSGTPQPPPFDPKKVLAEWSGCMSQENFNAANMTQAWSTLASSGLQKCINCHGGAIGGFLILTQATPYFETMTTTTAVLLKYFTVNAVDKKVVVNTGSFESANKIQGHPTFDVLNNNGMIALKKLYDSTAARKAANTCDPPRLKD